MKLLPNVEYWSTVAGCYDELYKDGYSQCEDETIAALLQATFLEGDILDVGCGTGLGRRLLPAPLNYWGCDISPEMICHARQCYPALHFQIMDANDLGYENQSFDGLMALYSVFSFLDDPALALSHFARVLRPGAPILLMALNAHALWRRVRNEYEPNVLYATRHSHSIGTLAHFYTMQQFQNLCSCFFDGYCIGMSTLGNLYEDPRLWGIDHRFSRRFPGLSHNLIYVGRKR